MITATVSLHRERPTLQQYYDRIIEAVQDGTLPSFDEEHNCMYRHKDVQTGKQHQCVAGLLLHHDDHVVEGSPVSNEVHSALFLQRLPEGLNIRQLQSLQSIHDSYARNYVDPTIKWKKKNEFINRVNEFFKSVDMNIQTVPVNHLES